MNIEDVLRGMSAARKFGAGEYGQMTLGELIDYLASLPAEHVFAEGFDSPHSYRGYYEDCAFEPAENTTAGAMLEAARSALDRTFQGYKGGDFLMGKDTLCWVATYGSCGKPIVRRTESFALEDPADG